MADFGLGSERDVAPRWNPLARTARLLANTDETRGEAGHSTVG